MEKSIIIIGAGISGLSIASLLSKDGFDVRVFEKMNKVGGRTASSIYKNHILDNGFHIMPFYKKSSIFQIFKELNIEKNIELSRVDKIAFYSNSKFYSYPKGIIDILRLSLIPFWSRVSLLKALLKLGFTSLEKSKKLDDVSVKRGLSYLDPECNAFFEAVCVLAFADTSDNVSLGEFTRTISRANPLKGGTSDFAYPSSGGYDKISIHLSEYIKKNNGQIYLNSPVKKIIVENNLVKGVILQNGETILSDCVIVSNPAYESLRFFDDDIFPTDFIKKITDLNKTTSVVEVHFALSKKISDLQVIFPAGNYMCKGIFFISNITPSVSPKNEHLIISGTPVNPADLSKPGRINEIVSKMKEEISSIFPDFQKNLIWERPMSWNLVESVVKAPGMVWESKMPHYVPYVNGLFFVGDSTISYGIGTDSAAHSSLLCYKAVRLFLSG